MSRAIRTLMHVIIIAAAVVTPLIWMPLVRPSAQIWGFRFGLPIAAVVMIWLLLRKSESIADPTDHLRNHRGHYFERRGLCFHPRLAAIDGVCWLEVHFQGRYLGVCRASRAASAAIQSLAIAGADRKRLQMRRRRIRSRPRPGRDCAGCAR